MCAEAGGISVDSGSVDFGCRDAFYLLRTQGAQRIRAHTEADTWNPNSEVRGLPARLGVSGVLGIALRAGPGVTGFIWVVVKNHGPFLGTL